MLSARARSPIWVLAIEYRLIILPHFRRTRFDTVIVAAKGGKGGKEADKKGGAKAGGASTGNAANLPAVKDAVSPATFGERRGLPRPSGECLTI